MNVVILSPHFPPNFHPFCLRLHEEGVTVLAIDQVPLDSLDHQLRNSFHDYYQVSNLHNIQELMQACEYFIRQYGPISCLESHNEHWLQTQAILRSRYQIPGIKQEQIDSVKRKSQMKAIFASAGMRVAKGSIAQDLTAALRLAQTVGYPLMAKPDIGVGAIGCRKILHEGDLVDIYCNDISKEYLLEEFIDGQICTFDGLVNQDGHIIFHISYVYDRGIAEIVQQKMDAYYYSLIETPSDLEAIGRKTVTAFQPRGSFFHFEYFRTHQNQLIPIEVNMRPPGGLTLDMCNYACDIDLYKQWAKITKGCRQSFTYQKTYSCMHINRRFENSYFHSHEEILSRFQSQIVHHQSVNPLYRQTTGDYCYLARSTDLELLHDVQRFIQAKH